MRYLQMSTENFRWKTLLVSALKFLKECVGETE